MGKAQIDIPTERIAEFCRQNHIRRLALFGSVLRDDFGPDSDVDVLVEFEPEARVGLLGRLRNRVERIARAQGGLEHARLPFRLLPRPGPGRSGGPV